MTVKPHANIEECDRELAHVIWDGKPCKYPGTCSCEHISRLIADFRTERERMVRLEEAQMWRQLKADLRPDSLFLGWIPERIAELGGTE